MIKKLSFLKYNLDDNNNLTENINVDLFINDFNKLDNEFLLNKDTDREQFNTIENAVNNIFLFHSKRLSLDLNNEYYISFSLENNDKFHVNYFIHDNNKSKERVYPICTSLTYLNNSLNPVVITDLDFEDYKYKNFKNSTNLLFSFPFKFEHICFDGKYYYGIPNIYEDKNIKPQILKVNIWDKKPNNIDYYISEKPDNDNINLINFMFKESPFHRQLCLDKNIINKNFFDEMLYAKNNDLFLNLKVIFDNIENYFIVEENIQINKRLEHRLPIEVNLFDSNNLLIIQTDKLPLIQNKTFNELKNKYGNILYDICPIYYKKELVNTNRFYNYKLTKNYFTKDVCKWLTNQIEIFIRNQQIQKTSLIKCENISNIFDFCLVVIESIYDNLLKIYDLNEITIDINNICVLYLNNNVNGNKNGKNTDNNDNDNNDSNNNDDNNKEIDLIKNHIKNNNSFLMGIFKLNENLTKIHDNIELNMGDLLFANTLRVEDIVLFNDISADIEATTNKNYYLIYEINLNLSQ